MSDRMPLDVMEAAVEVCGTAFYYHGRVRSIFLSCGVPETMYVRHAVEGASKFVIARNVFADLSSRGAEGQRILRLIVTDLTGITKPDSNATDQRKGLAALDTLRHLAGKKKIIVDVEVAERESRKKTEEAKVASIRSRQEKLDDLKTRLAALVVSKDSPQARGYELERLLVDLFALHELTYKPSYRRPHEQIDAAVEYKNFTYLIEARWRVTPPDFGSLADFKAKVDGKLESTRGIFVSMAGFDEGVTAHFMGAARGTRNNLILMDGQDFSLILEDNPGLLDALNHKIAKASQEGIWWAPLAVK